MTLETINGIFVTAPMFEKASPEALAEIINLLDRASFHHASDYRNEDHLAAKAIKEAAEKAFGLGLRPHALRHILNHKDQLVSVDAFMWAFVGAAQRKAKRDFADQAVRAICTYAKGINGKTDDAAKAVLGASDVVSQLVGGLQ